MMTHETWGFVQIALANLDSHLLHYWGPDPVQFPIYPEAMRSLYALRREFGRIGSEPNVESPRGELLSTTRAAVFSKVKQLEEEQLHSSPVPLLVEARLLLQSFQGTDFLANHALDLLKRWLSNAESRCRVLERQTRLATFVVTHWTQPSVHLPIVSGLVTLAAVPGKFPAWGEIAPSWWGKLGLLQDIIPFQAAVIGRALQNCLESIRGFSTLGTTYEDLGQQLAQILTIHRAHFLAVSSNTEAHLELLRLQLELGETEESFHHRLKEVWEISHPSKDVNDPNLILLYFEGIQTEFKRKVPESTAEFLLPHKYTAILTAVDAIYSVFERWKKNSYRPQSSFNIRPAERGGLKSLILTQTPSEPTFRNHTNNNQYCLGLPVTHIESDDPPQISDLVQEYPLLAASGSGLVRKRPLLRAKIGAGKRKNYLPSKANALERKPVTKESQARESPTLCDWAPLSEIGKKIAQGNFQKVEVPLDRNTCKLVTEWEVANLSLPIPNLEKKAKSSSPKIPKTHHLVQDPGETILTYYDRVRRYCQSRRRKRDQFPTINQDRMFIEGLSNVRVRGYMLRQALSGPASALILALARQDWVEYDEAQQTSDEEVLDYHERFIGLFDRAHAKCKIDQEAVQNFVMGLWNAEVKDAVQMLQPMSYPITLMAAQNKECQIKWIKAFPHMRSLILETSSPNHLYKDGEVNQLPGEGIWQYHLRFPRYVIPRYSLRVVNTEMVIRHFLAGLYDPSVRKLIAREKDYSYYQLLSRSKDIVPLPDVVMTS